MGHHPRRRKWVSASHAAAERRAFVAMVAGARSGAGPARLVLCQIALLLAITVVPILMAE